MGCWWLNRVIKEVVSGDSYGKEGENLLSFLWLWVGKVDSLSIESGVLHGNGVWLLQSVAVETTGGCAAPTPIMEVSASLVASAALAGLSPDPWEVAAAGL